MAYNEAVDERAQKKLRDWAKNDALEIDNAIKDLLERRSGRRLLYWLLEMSRAIGVNAFTGNALTTAFECGQQNVGQQFMARVIEVAPEGFLMVLKEQSDERAERGAATNARTQTRRDAADEDDAGANS